MEHTTVTGVFERGGVRGVAIAGAAAAALDSGICFERSIGTSAGALVGSPVAAGYSSKELSGTVCSIPWSGLLDPVPGRGSLSLADTLLWCSERASPRRDRLEEVWGDLLARIGVRVFGDLPPQALSVVVTDLSHSSGLSLPEALPRHGIDPMTFSVARAVRISAAIPFMFTPVPLRDRARGETVLIADGAMATDFPIGLADPQNRVLAFRLVGDERAHLHEKSAGPASLAYAVVLAGIRARYSLPRHSLVDTESIQVPVATDLDFDMDGDAARSAFDRAHPAAMSQFGNLESSYPSPPANSAD